MSIQKVNLVTRNNEKIIGVKLADGSIGEIKFTIDTKTAHQACTLPESIFVDPDGMYIFVLQTGEELKESYDNVVNYSVDHWMGI